MPNEHESIWVVFNGEIYNHINLRSQLIALGHCFRSDHSDTEVIVHGYEQWGIEGLLQRIEGDYGIALWDSRRESLFLIRDRVGVKPLYFSLPDGLILFASEIKGILAHPSVERDIEPVAMYHYLSFLTTPAPFTMFKGVFKIPAGHYIEIGNNEKFSAVRYWDATPGGGIVPEAIAGMDREARESFYVAGIRKRLEKAVEKRLMSDVPMGVFLSGGIDSSTNVALMSRMLGRPVDTFTVGFKDYGHLNELSEAGLVADKFNTRHHEVLIDENDMRDYLADLIYSQDEPIADWVCIPLYFVAKLAKDSGVTVVQVGEGADEQFCGYGSYMAYLKLYRNYWQPFRNLFPVSVQKMIAEMAGRVADLSPALDIYADIIDRASRNREPFWSGAMVFWERVKKRLVVPGSIPVPTVPVELIESGLLPSSYLHADTFNVIGSFTGNLDRAYPGRDVLTRMIYNEFKLRLPELLLMRVDKICMSVSLEARVPFLDHQLVEYAMDISMADKVHGFTAKYLLKKAVAGLIPDQIIHRRKMGFSAPMAQWLRGDFGRQVQTAMMKSKLLSQGFFDHAFINSLFADHLANRSDNSLYIWTLFNLTAWYDHWIDVSA